MKVQIGPQRGRPSSRAGMLYFKQLQLSSQHLLSSSRLLLSSAFCLLLRLSKSDFPVRLLPRVTEAGSSAGVSARYWHGIAAGTPVTVAMGDLQCYMLATLLSDTDAGL